MLGQWEVSDIQDDSSPQLKEEGDENSSWPALLESIINPDLSGKIAKAGLRPRSTKKEIKDVPKLSRKEIKVAKVWLANGRKKPNVLEKNKEKQLKKIAVGGVVKLFNAVAAHQRDQKKSREGGNKAEVKESMKNVNRSSFLKYLMSGNLNSESTSEIKEEAKKAEGEVWAALKEDFMSTTKLRNWDKEEKKD